MHSIPDTIHNVSFVTNKSNDFLARNVKYTNSNCFTLNLYENGCRGQKALKRQVIMICDRNTCNEEHADTKICEQSDWYNEDKFIKNLRHEKCKVIRLVRQQIDRFHDTQFTLSSVSAVSRRPFKSNLQDTSYEMKGQESNVKVITTNPLTSDSPATRQERLMHVLKRIRQRVCLMVLVAGIIVLMSILYGVYSRAYLCNNGRSCVTTVRYSQAKYTLF